MPVVTNTTHTPVGITAAPEIVGESSILNLFPNPTSGSFTVQLNKCEMGNINVRVLNLFGQVVYYQTAIANANDFEHKVHFPK